MPSLYTITEPHPTVPQDSYTHSGRGGLGNFFRAPLTTSPSGVPTKTTSTTSTSSTTSSTPRRFYSGRGGAGNAHHASPTTHTPALSSFDEEFALRESALATVVGHVGRGGAGNVYSSSSAASMKGAVDGEALARRDSASTEGSARSSGSLAGFWGRVKSAGR
jgi:hypothetical protein